MPLLLRTTLFYTPSTPPPPPPPQSQSWSFTSSLPISYRVAILLDASILLFTLAIIIGAILYLRIRRPLSHTTRPNSTGSRYQTSGSRTRTARDEEESLLESKDGYFSSVSNQGLRIKVQEMSQRDKDDLRVGGMKSPGGLRTPGGEYKKKGHVRWTPSVQGGEVFGIVDKPEGEGGKGKGKEEEQKKCRCRGRRHPGCWRFELQFEGAKPVLGKERDEGMGRPGGGKVKGR